MYHYYNKAFTKDSNIFVEVIPNEKIEMDGHIESHSGTAKLLLGDPLKLADTLDFKCQDEILDDLKQRIEADEN